MPRTGRTLIVAVGSDTMLSRRALSAAKRSRRDPKLPPWMLVSRAVQLRTHSGVLHRALGPLPRDDGGPSSVGGMRVMIVHPSAPNQVGPSWPSNENGSWYLSHSVGPVPRTTDPRRY